MTFAEKLRELRAAKGMSEQKLAEATGIPFGTIHDYMNRPSRPAFDVVLRICKALGVDCTAFAGCSDFVGTGEQPSNSAAATGKATRRRPGPKPEAKAPPSPPRGRGRGRTP